MYKLSTADKSQCCDGLCWERFGETRDSANRSNGVDGQQQHVTIGISALLSYRSTRSSSFRRKSEVLGAGSELLSEEGGNVARPRTII